MKRVIQGDPHIAIAYLRVSTDDQANGLDAQRSAIESYARAHGVTIAGTFTDEGKSGSLELGERPGLVSAVAALRGARAGLLLAHKRDRVARDVAIARAIELAVARSGATLVSADGAGNGDAPTDRLLRTILDAFAEQERAMIGLRTKAALAAKAARGECVGTVPYGYQRAGASLEPCEREQATVKAARALRAQGLTYRALRLALAAQGHVSRSGAPFTLAALHALLKVQL